MFLCRELNMIVLKEGCALLVIALLVVSVGIIA
jgi:hypothetical protein